ncbi:MAG: iron-sulfur cluster assembly protein [Candidatus Neomarinimicrobiota bacterium]
MKVREEQVIDVLKQCYDPEIPIDLWNLGLIYDVKIDESAGGESSNVDILMSLTTPGCGMGGYMAEDIMNKVESIPGVSQADVKITFEPRWTPEMMSDEARARLGFGNDLSRQSQSPGQVRDEEDDWA